MVLKLKETADQLQNDGVLPAGGTPEQFLARIRKEIEIQCGRRPAAASRRALAWAVARDEVLGRFRRRR
jgi:hypothetical protein